LTSRFVRECVVVGYQQDENGSVDLVAIIHPDYEQIESLYGFTYRRAQLELELKRAIAEVNASVLPQKRIKAFLVRETAFPKTASGAIPRVSVADLYRKVYSGEK
jgi:acyl-coenzyme A synthetase/AMP-(fatty) acid ligase